MQISNILKVTWVAYVAENISKELSREKGFTGKYQLLNYGSELQHSSFLSFLKKTRWK